MKVQNGTGGFLHMSMTNTIGSNPKLAELLTKASTTEANQATSALSDNLTETYSTRYIKPTGDSAAIMELGNIFNSLMGHCPIEVKDGIGEYYRVLSNRQLPAFEWILEAFHVASKKEDHKRNFPYVVGMLRRWMKYGFGHIPSQEEDEVVAYFEEVTGTEVSAQARLVLQNLMGVYGAIKVTRMIGGLERDLDMLMASVLKDALKEKFPNAGGQMSSTY